MGPKGDRKSVGDFGAGTGPKSSARGADRFGPMNRQAEIGPCGPFGEMGPSGPSLSLEGQAKAYRPNIVVNGEKRNIFAGFSGV